MQVTLWIVSVCQQAKALWKEYSLTRKKAIMGSELLGVLARIKSKHDGDEVHCKVFAVTDDMMKRFNRLHVFFCTVV